MNDDLAINDIMNATISIANGGTVDGSMITLPLSTTLGSATLNVKSEKDLIVDLLDEHIMSQYTIDHKLQEQELMKLKDVEPNYAEMIKENIAKNLARDIAKKVSYTKKREEDTHHFIGRVWCFTTEELTKLIEEARRV